MHPYSLTTIERDKKLLLSSPVERHEDSTGFSLIELVVVVAVIGIIIVIAVIYFGNVQDSTRQAAVDVASRDGFMLAQQNMAYGDPTGGDLSPLETDNVRVMMTNDFIVGDADTLCVRADWIGTHNYSLSGACEDGSVSPPPSDLPETYHTRLIYQCPTTRSGYLGVVNIANDTTVEMWESDNKESTVREVEYGEPDSDFDLRFETRQEILLTEAVEHYGNVEAANAYFQQLLSNAADAGIDQADVPAYSLSNTVSNASEQIVMEQGIEYVVEFDGQIETFSAPDHGLNEGVPGLSDCLVEIDHFGDNIGLKNVIYLGGDNLTAVPDNLPSSVRSLRGAFSRATNFNDPNIRYWDTRNVHTMRSMFINAYEFDQDISTWVDPVSGETFWDVSNVDSMRNMFQGTSAFNQNLSSWNTSSLRDVGRMFLEATAFNNGSAAGVGDNPLTWDLSNAEDAIRMFDGATRFNQNISSFGMENMEIVTRMFLNATAFNNGSEAGVGDNPLTWDLSNVRETTRMFDAASSFNQDVTSFGMENVVDVRNMFRYATVFNNGDEYRVDNTPLTWNTENFELISQMFWDAEAFNQDLSSWNLSNVTSSNNWARGTGLADENMPSLS